MASSLLEKAAKEVGADYLKRADDAGDESAKSINWEGAGGFFQMILSMILPLFQSCLGTQTPAQIAKRSKDPGPLASARLEMHVRRRMREEFRRPRDVSAATRHMVSALKAKAAAMEEDELVAVIQESDDD